MDEAIEAVVGNDEAWKLVVQRGKRRAVLCESHEDPTAGHFGRDKTHERVARLYFWPKLYRSVRDFVQRCLVCQQTKAEQKWPAGLMGQRVVERPWQVVTGDVTGHSLRAEMNTNIYSFPGLVYSLGGMQPHEEGKCENY